VLLVDALFRELKFGLAGSGGLLDGKVAQSHIKQDMRQTVDQERAESDYPWIIFSEITENEDQVNYARHRYEVEIIGLRNSATKGDALLREIRGILLDHFKCKHRTWGKFDADGNADPSGGVKAKCSYGGSINGFDEGMVEKRYLLTFVFAFVRQ
jgi:hypothetical protein